MAQTRTDTFNETVRREELDVQKDGVERVTGVDTVDGNVSPAIDPNAPRKL